MPIYCYECTDAHCRHVTDEYFPSVPAVVPDALPCPKCGHTAERSFRAEVRQTRADPPDWVSVSAGVMPNQVAQANRQYAHLGVTFDRDGNAHVPGRNRSRFLKERGLHDR